MFSYYLWGVFLGQAEQVSMLLLTSTLYPSPSLEEAIFFVSVTVPFLAVEQ